MKTSVEKMDILQEKISQLKAEQGKIEQEIISYFVQVLKMNNAFQIDFNVMVGGLLEVIGVIKSDSEKKEVWRIAGQKFCKKNIKARHKRTHQVQSKVDGQDD